MEGPTYEAIVIGAGPGGLATLAALCDAGLKPVLWIDRTFEGGRLNTVYREISSNTKIRDYLKAIYSSPVCASIIKSIPAPNAVTNLESMDRDKTCKLSFAGDMVLMLLNGLLKRSEVQNVEGAVEKASLNGHIWTVSTSKQNFKANRLFMCTGSRPKSSSMHYPFNKDLTVLDLDECMLRSHLPSALPKDRKSVVAVIGNSHSGILCCKNLYESAKSKERDIKIVNFGRRPIKYAKYVDNGIIFDNTGLKGSTAEWAKEVMENDPDPEIIEQVDLSQNHDLAFREHLSRCTHIIYAIGYTRSPLPALYIDGQLAGEELTFDMHSSGFHYGDRAERVRGLYANGIAFPEEVKDPEGHVEAAVGVAKFFSFAERMKKNWLGLE
ncbi:unnamed protein product [Penicillium nalgiovense]|uniref:FAD/NAD(P)-binding domain-containing protein n=1 Tax=Penicillium nalgiovense TaxID=60175 RepID=A0A9W4MW38_PENNA|nr:unnamed protein product [Penicillium nalgiovense]CAG7962758.1 unnamed protein product [Penicillium nalgiovense]CAG7965004.1 unnamed protein product [Penicillium nalgiovense]CAG7965021.1 unnamed protein product [Penicillium nalgiovense]CAG7970306.1 unnamed protein product [Penicillium nalgiovense]